MNFNNHFDSLLKDANSRIIDISSQLQLLRLSGKNDEDEYRRLIFELRIAENVKFVRSEVSKFENLSKDEQELFSIGMLGLVKAAKTFDESKKAKFITYASKCIKNEFRMYARKIKQLKREVSLSKPIATDFSGNELILEDILVSGEDLSDIISKRLYNDTLIDKALTVIRNFSPIEQEVIKKRVFVQKPVAYKKLGEEFGHNAKYMDRLEKRLLKLIRSELDKEINVEYKDFA